MNKKMRALVSLSLAATMIMGMVGCSKAATKEETKPEGTKTEDQVFEIKLGHVLATSHPVHVALSDAAERILEKTDGAVELQIYPNGELSSYSDGVEAVISGAPYMFYSSPGQLADYVPNMSALQAPFLYKTFEEYSNLMGTEVIEGLEAEAEAQGIKVLSLNFVSGFRHILADKPIIVPSNANNLTMRVPGNAVFIDPMEAIGVVTSTINWNETYSALSQGTVDSIEGTVGNIYDAKMFELKKEISKTAHVIDLSGLFIGTKYWDTIPTEYQAIIEEEIVAAEKQQNAAAEQIETDYITKLEDEGVTFHEVEIDGFIEATSHLVDQYEIGPKLVETLKEVNG